jgi:L-fuculose-phosphate aldolase
MGRFFKPEYNRRAMPLPLTETPSDALIDATRARIAQIGRLLFARQLTDAAGGNISVRIGNRVCITPRYAGQQRQWQIDPGDVLVADLDRNVLRGAGKLSRETHVHFTLLTRFHAHGTAVVHAHPRNLLVYAFLRQPMPPALEAMRKFGVTPVTPFAPAHSTKLAEHVATTMVGREAMIAKHAAAAIAPWHGVFCMGKDLSAAFDAVERMDNNAYLLLMARQHAGAAAIDQALADMERTIAAHDAE